jgi:ribosomal-protein-alanine N-acetyltransferase
MIEIPTLTTERLVLRAPCAGDFPAYAAFRVSERARSVGGPYSRARAFEQFCALIGHWEMRGYGRWVVADRETGAPLGVVGLFYPEDWPEPEIGWSLFEEAEGRGIATEAALASRAYAYDRLGWTRVVSLIDPDNHRSVALARQLGCTPEGTHPHPEHGDITIWRHPGPGEAA